MRDYALLKYTVPVSGKFPLLIFTSKMAANENILQSMVISECLTKCATITGPQGG